MSTLERRLLNSIPEAFHATTSAHGLYSPNQFVLRLSPLVHQTLEGAPKGIVSDGTPFKVRQAMSTLLHETIHWWQHIGSTYGFIYGLNYPVQAHGSYNELRQLIDGDGFKKSVLSQAELLGRSGHSEWGTPVGNANIIVNNHFDLETFRLFTLGPDFAKTFGDDRRFENVGHALYVTYSLTVAALASSVDEQLQVLPDVRNWKDGFKELRDRQQHGFYYGSPIDVWPVGSYEIFEGQARFAQIQYLARSSLDVDWQDFASIGMLDGVYVKAFLEFLRLTESEWPSSVGDPLVSLFLLVCDLAINPASGFPLKIEPTFSTFIEDVHPGARFSLYCRHIANSFSTMKTAIRFHNRDEYAELSGHLAKANKDTAPLSIAQLCSTWFSESGRLAHLKTEFDSYQFDARNFVLRHLFAHFLAFQTDKLAHPEFFCWPGFHMVGEELSNDTEALFERHGALFVDKADDDGIFPRIQRGRTEAQIYETFQTFYAGNVIFDLVRQWITEDGPFRYDLSWLKVNSSRVEQADFMRRNFKSAFGVDPADVQEFKHDEGLVARLRTEHGR